MYWGGSVLFVHPVVLLLTNGNEKCLPVLGRHLRQIWQCLALLWHWHGDARACVWDNILTALRKRQEASLVTRNLVMQYWYSIIIYILIYRIKLKIDYETSSNCTALQWLDPEQTAGKRQPYVFSQCQAIHCRSMVPCQDTPSVKMPYTAEVYRSRQLHESKVLHTTEVT